LSPLASGAAIPQIIVHDGFDRHSWLPVTAHRWRLTLPRGAYEVPVSPPPECSSMTHLRGELSSGAPFFGVVSTRDLGGQTLHGLCRDLARSIVSGVAPRKVAVPGTRAALRVDGLIDMEEGLTEDGVERITVVVGQTDAYFILLTLRSRPQDAVGTVIEDVVASFGVVHQ
jgi:hypothetical protein